jgi:hypothetical protein
MALIVGAFRLLDIRFTDLFRDFINKPQSIRTQIDEATNRKKKRFIVRQIEEVSEIMRLTDREDKIPVVFIACAVFAIAGAIIASLFDNVFLIPVLGIGMMCLPVWYIKLTASHFKKDISEELETALSVISSAYIRNEDIVTAVEENVHYLKKDEAVIAYLSFTVFVCIVFTCKLCKVSCLESFSADCTFDMFASAVFDGCSFIYNPFARCMALRFYIICFICISAVLTYECTVAHCSTGCFCYCYIISMSNLIYIVTVVFISANFTLVDAVAVNV